MAVMPRGGRLAPVRIMIARFFSHALRKIKCRGAGTATVGPMERGTAAIRLEVNGEDREFHGRGDTPLLWVLRDAFGTPAR